ncbi:MAG: DUF4831 family protein [Muribaculaceae bacterium]|nr:DUF4831 family protein [Muribaculaceae bacterium]
MKIVAMVVAAMLIAPAVVAQTTQRLTATKANDYGLMYSLPVTAVNVTVEAQITVKRPGEFAKYAAKYLNVVDPILESSTSVEVKSVVISTSGVPNESERYLVSLKSGRAPYIILSEDNIPLSINTEQVYEPNEVELPVSVAAEPTPLETAAARQVITQEMLQSHSSAKRAELAAEQIYSLRQSRTDIITGQAEQMPPDGAAMQMVLENINAQEQALMAMFIGTTSVSTHVRTMQIVPDGDITNQVVARVSAEKGVVEASDLSGMPVYLTLKVTKEGELPVNDKGEQLTMPKGGVAYCIPGKTQISVKFDGVTMAEKEVDMAQFGVVYGMNPANFSDKKAPVFLLFDPRTGAAVEVGPATL